ncbi:hypothetical protein SAY86_015452 [Trapa natans]|uniref:Uncharacterized protein n=1 Tax=Trapa natans TaxID=22666 RepID=A0AAN7LAG6_TRANT|nr:hypothetical protein SAY86_015452 [Trapa natans]
MGEWAGPSNAIEGYVPQKECENASSPSKAQKEGCKPNNLKHGNTNIIIS